MADDDSLSRRVARLHLSDLAGPSTNTGSTKADKRFWIPIDRRAVERVLANFTFDLHQPSLEAGLNTPLINLLRDFAETVGSRLVIEDTHKKAIFCAPPSSPSSTMPEGTLFLHSDHVVHGPYVVAFFDIKRKSRSTFSNDDRRQIMSYAHRLLAIEQTERTEVTAFLINDQIVQFCRCRVQSGGLEYETSHTVPVRRESGSSTIPEGLYQLHAFFTAGNLGYVPVSHPFSSLTHSDLLGSGGSSRVFAICDREDHVLKVMADEEDCERESAMLRIIEREKIPHVPRLIEAGQGALVLFPRATPIVAGQLHCRHALQVLDTLEAVHKISLYHRDICPVNLMLVEHNILVNDWGCKR
jgi:hypothetical protein